MSTKDTDTKPSEMFLDSMSEGGIGSEMMTCEWCDRLHLCPDFIPDLSLYWGDSLGSREKDAHEHKLYCEDEYKKNPTGVVLHYDCDCVVGRYLNNKLFVLTCPCNGLYRYEEFIWSHRNTIRTYLKERIEQEASWAEQELTLNKLAGISK